jgi:hypothetical protein
MANGGYRSSVKVTFRFRSSSCFMVDSNGGNLALHLQYSGLLSENLYHLTYHEHSSILFVLFEATRSKFGDKKAIRTKARHRGNRRFVRAVFFSSNTAFNVAQDGVVQAMRLDLWL